MSFTAELRKIESKVSPQKRQSRPRVIGDNFQQVKAVLDLITDDRWRLEVDSDWIALLMPGEERPLEGTAAPPNGFIVLSFFNGGWPATLMLATPTEKSLFEKTSVIVRNTKDFEAAIVAHLDQPSVLRWLGTLQNS